MEVNTNNIEEQILLYVDGELDTAGAKALLQYIALHPEWRTMLEEYKSLVMQPDTAIVFEGKDALLQPEEAGQTIVFKKANNFKQLRWAAAAVLLIGAAGLTWMLNREEEGLVLPATTGSVALQPKQLPATAIVSLKDTIAPTAVVATTQRATVAQSTVARPTQPQKQEAPQESSGARNQAPVVTPLAGSTVTAIAMEEQPLAGRELQLPETQQQHVTEEVAINADALPQWLPVNAEKLEGVNDLLGHIKNVKDKVAAKAAVLKNSTFVLRFGAKEIAIGK